MRSPSATLVLDAAVLISAAFGRSAGIILDVASVRALVTTERVVEEVRRRIGLGARRPEVLPLIDILLEEVTVVPLDSLQSHFPGSEIALRDGAASRNGSTRDAHVLALAWDTGADIWTTDRDFAGTGVATWSTPNLMRALAERA
ncbi:MAG TPA: PIN domain-containing protein [Rhizomicrobium sp.]